MCSAFFIVGCSNKKEEQLQRDLDFIAQQQGKFLAIEDGRFLETEEKIKKIYADGFRKQILIKKLNLINEKISSAFVFYKKPDISFNEMDSMQASVLGVIRKELSDTLLIKNRLVFPEDVTALIKQTDSCVNLRRMVSLPLELGARITELIVFKNKIIDLFASSTKKISSDELWGWNPFHTTIKIKNYSENKVSYLDIDFSFYVSRNSVKYLQNQKGDTLPLSLIKIKYERDSAFLKLNLSDLKPGKYKLNVCTQLITPEMDRRLNKLDSPEYCQPIDFEVFK
jgi:hypothetical protein